MKHIRVTGGPWVAIDELPWTENGHLQSNLLENKTSSGVLKLIPF